MECARCDRRSPFWSVWDHQCEQCGAVYDEGCEETSEKSVFMEKRFLGQLDVMHREFICVACNKANAWHRRERTFPCGLTFFYSRETDCDCSGGGDY